MEVLVRISTPFRSLMNGQAEVSVKGKTVKEVIENLEKSYNGIKEKIFDEQGNQRPFVNLYLNNEDIRFLQNLDTEIKNRDILSIVLYCPHI